MEPIKGINVFEAPELSKSDGLLHDFAFGFAFADESLIAFREIHDFFGGIIFSPCVFVIHRKPFLFLTSLFYSLYAFYLLKRFRLARRVGGPLRKSK